MSEGELRLGIVTDFDTMTHENITIVSCEDTAMLFSIYWHLTIRLNYNLVGNHRKRTFSRRQGFEKDFPFFVVNISLAEIVCSLESSAMEPPWLGGYYTRRVVGALVVVVAVPLTWLRRGQAQHFNTWSEIPHRHQIIRGVCVCACACACLRAFVCIYAMVYICCCLVCVHFWGCPAAHRAVWSLSVYHLLLCLYVFISLSLYFARAPTRALCCYV